MTELRKLITPGTAKKHGKWGRNKRVQNIQLGIDSQRYIFDESNTALLKNMAKATRKEGALERDESGSLEKNWDEINSFEYGLYPFRGIMFSQPGKEETNE